MTVVVAFLCADGVVVGADSMLTPSLGNMSVGHHKGVKVHVIAGPQLFAFAGDQGQAARFRMLAEMNAHLTAQGAHPLEYPLVLAQGVHQQFQATGIASNAIGVNTILAFLHGGDRHCCVFEQTMQPRLLDQYHYYVALGIGKLSADPFLRFLVDVFCRPGQPPTVRQAIFLTAWTIQHVIDTNPGGVAGPIKIAVFEHQGGSAYLPRELPETEIEEHQQAIESAAAAMRDWQARIESGAAAEGTPEVPVAPIALLPGT